jgi:hypothetical protein
VQSRVDPKQAYTPLATFPAMLQPRTRAMFVLDFVIGVLIIVAYIWAGLVIEMILDTIMSSYPRGRLAVLWVIGVLAITLNVILIRRKMKTG